MQSVLRIEQREQAYLYIEESTLGNYSLHQSLFEIMGALFCCHVAEDTEETTSPEEPQNAEKVKRTAKYQSFVEEPFGNKPVSEIPGIGDVTTKRLKDAGFPLVSKTLIAMIVVLCIRKA